MRSQAWVAGLGRHDAPTEGTGWTRPRAAKSRGPRLCRPCSWLSLARAVGGDTLPGRFGSSDHGLVADPASAPASLAGRDGYRPTEVWGISGGAGGLNEVPTPAATPSDSAVSTAVSVAVSITLSTAAGSVEAVAGDLARHLVGWRLRRDRRCRLDGFRSRFDYRFGWTSTTSAAGCDRPGRRRERRRPMLQRRQ